MHSLTETVKRTLTRHDMAGRGQRVLLAVSGGPDSTAMLHVMAELAPGLGFTLSVAHLDHGFRPESAEEARFVAGMAHGMGLECTVGQSDLKERLAASPANKQAAARDARYAFLETVADKHGAGAIAVGHTADDQAETCMMREIRGSGAQGLAAIPPVRGRIIRPLIDATREQVMSYLTERGIPYRTDPTNLQPVYLRNRLRQELMPLLRGYNPQIVHTLCQSADILREEDDFLSAFAVGVLDGLTTAREDGKIELDLAGFAPLHAAVKRRVLRHAVMLVKGDLLSIGYGHIIDAAHSIASGGTGRGVDLPGGVRIERSYGRLLICRAGTPQADFSVALPVPGRATVDALGVVVEARLVGAGEARQGDDKASALFDLDKLSGPLTVRGRRPGDVFHPVGMSGSRKIKEFFIDMKMPRLMRARTPILDCGGEVAWVMGHGVDGRFAAHKDTKRAVLITYNHKGR